MSKFVRNIPYSPQNSTDGSGEVHAKVRRKTPRGWTATVRKLSALNAINEIYESREQVSTRYRKSRRYVSSPQLGHVGLGNLIGVPRKISGKLVTVHSFFV